MNIVQALRTYGSAIAEDETGKVIYVLVQPGGKTLIYADKGDLKRRVHKTNTILALKEYLENEYNVVTTGDEWEEL